MPKMGRLMVDDGEEDCQIISKSKNEVFGHGGVLGVLGFSVEMSNI